MKRLVYSFGVVLFLGLAAHTQTAIGQATHLSPQEYAAQLRLAEGYEATRDVANAVRIYSELYTQQPADREVFDGLVRGMLYLKKYDELESIVRTRLDKETNEENLLLYARVEARLNKHALAMDAFNKALTLDGNSTVDCSAALPVVFSMIDVGYNQEALAVLQKMPDATTSPECSSQIASLYLRLGDYAQAAKQFVRLLDKGEAQVGMVEQRLAQYTTDSVSRTNVIAAVRAAIPNTPSLPSLQLLAWIYGEEKDYEHAFETTKQIDDLGSNKLPGNHGYELLLFAEKARNEGALDIAVKAYDEALKRLHAGDNRQRDYFIGQAELGALRTTEAYLLSTPQVSNDAMTKLIARYETYAEHQPMTELAMAGLLSAANLSFHNLFDLPRAQKDYERVLARSGATDNARDALFGLTEIALASKNITQANLRLKNLDELLITRSRASDKEAEKHVMFERALIDYYQGAFDSASSKLNAIMADPSSDYANDAIGLAATISENNTMSSKDALRLFAKASLAEYAHEYDEARSAYHSIIESYPNAPIADDAAMREAEMLVKLNRMNDAVTAYETMIEKMPGSSKLDQAAFREAEIVQLYLHDNLRAERLYEEFLAHYPQSNLLGEARDRARKLRGDVF